MNYLLPFLLGLSATILFVWLCRRHDPDDAAAGVSLGVARHSNVETPAAPASTSECRATWPAKHFISACMYCHRVTRAGRHAEPIRVGDELRVSHGICPACMAAKHPEVAHAAELQAA